MEKIEKKTLIFVSNYPIKLSIDQKRVRTPWNTPEKIKRCFFEKVIFSLRSLNREPRWKLKFCNIQQHAGTKIS